MNPLYPMTIRRVASIKAVIFDCPMSLHEIAVATHTSESYLIKCVNHMRANRSTYIFGWRQYGEHGIHIAVYAIGSGPDARKPRPHTQAQKDATYYKRRKNDKERQEFHLAHRRARDAANRASAAPQTWISALMGAA